MTDANSYESSCTWGGDVGANDQNDDDQFHTLLHSSEHDSVKLMVLIQLCYLTSVDKYLKSCK